MGYAGAEPKIDHLYDSLCLVQKNIFKFHVSMRNVPLMAKVNRLNYLGPQELRLQFRHLSIGLHLEVPVQTATVNVLHNYENLLVRLKGFIKFGYVRMVELLHNFHLSFD